LLWIISHPDEVTAVECDGYDRVLVASEVFARELESRVDVPVEVMYQATDPDRFAPAPDPELAVEVLFVGNSRHQDRMAVRAALEIGAPLTVYGQDWHDRLPSGVLAAEHFPNEKLGALYSSAGVTLNDHWPEMAAHGFISNRVFDIIASGGVVFTDPVEGLDGIFGGLVPTFGTPGELSELLEEWVDNREIFQSRMAEARNLVLEQHTFNARAARILAIVDELEWKPVESGF
jgi:spore maturation protein CgeB